MRTLKNLYWKSVIGISNLKNRKVGGASHFIEILVAVIVVIVVGAVFKTSVSNFITTITTEATNKAKALF